MTIADVDYKNVTREVGRQSECVTQTPWVTKCNPQSGAVVGGCDANSMGYKNVTREVGRL